MNQTQINREKHAHHLLFTFYPFRNETNLKLDGNYFAILQQSGVLDMINLNRQKSNPYRQFVNNALLNSQINVRSTYDFNHENEEIEQTFLNGMDSLCESEPSLSKNTVMSTGEMPLVVTDEELHEHIHLLSKKQQKVFDTVYSWLISYMKNLMPQDITTTQPLHLFIIDGPDSSKLFLIKILYQSLTKALLFLFG